MARASTTATSISRAKARLIWPPLLKPWSIICLTAGGRLSVAAEDTARAISQAVNRPLWRRTNGHSVRRLPRRRSGGGEAGASSLSVILVVVFYADTVTSGVAQADFQCVDLIGRQFDP